MARSNLPVALVTAKMMVVSAMVFCLFAESCVAVPFFMAMRPVGLRTFGWRGNLPANDQRVNLRRRENNNNNIDDDVHAANFETRLLNNAGSLFFLHKRSQPTTAVDVDAFGLSKRAPIFASDLHKRSQPDVDSADDSAAFGLSKRSQPGKPDDNTDFPFGLSKRSQPEPNLREQIFDDFGLRKRSQPKNEANLKDDFSFGLRKRSQPKNEDGDDLAFGLSKRSQPTDGVGVQEEFSFGLSKRSQPAASSSDEAEFPFGISKRTQNFGFPLFQQLSSHPRSVSRSEFVVGQKNPVFSQ